jgi:hypothetical protein
MSDKKYSLCWKVLKDKAIHDNNKELLKEMTEVESVMSKYVKGD